MAMQKGRLVESGPSDQMPSAPQSPYTRRLLAAMPRAGWTPRRGGKE